MTMQEYYETIGDYNDVITRLPSEKSIRKFVCKYVNDPSYKSLKQAIEENNYEEAFRQAHTLKGVARNLSFTHIYTLADEITEIFRDLQPHDVSDKMALLDAEYDKVVKVIAQIEAEDQQG